MVTGTVYLDLAAKGELARNHAWFVMNRTPDGARVVVYVGDLHPALLLDACRFLVEHAERVDIDVNGEPEAVRAWVDCLRAGKSWEVVA